MKRIPWAALFSALLLTAATACGSNSATGSKNEAVTLTLNWYPYGEHAPIYYGVKQGIFAKYGIDLKVQAGQGSGKTVQAVGGGQSEFGWADTAAVLSAAEKGVPVKSVGVFLQTTPASVQSFAEKRLSKPADLRGIKIAATAGDALSKTFPAFLRKNGMNNEDVKLENTDAAGKIAALLSGRVDALIGFANDQGPTIQEKSGKPMSYLRFSDFKLNFFGDGLITARQQLARKPDLVKRMVAAMSESWSAAERDPQGAVAAMAGASEQLPPAAVLVDQFKTTLTLLHTEASKTLLPGANTAVDWQQTIDTFKQTEIIGTQLDLGTVWAEDVAPTR
ncbi:ABC transporter substrate-binding protein [Nocardia panacis]|nr:ABC transporter substrate-binding protein [Nocardia panacis]